MQRSTTNWCFRTRRVNTNRSHPTKAESFGKTLAGRGWELLCHQCCARGLQGACLHPLGSQCGTAPARPEAGSAPSTRDYSSAHRCVGLQAGRPQRVPCICAGAELCSGKSVGTSSFANLKLNFRELNKLQIFLLGN